MQVTAAWQEGMAFRVTTTSGHEFTVDGPPALGGRNDGPRPMELLLAAIATCSGIDVVDILRKGKRDFKAVSVTVAGERATTVPAVFTSIQLQYRVMGANSHHAHRAAQLSADKYCSVLRMIAGNAAVSWSLEPTGAADA